MMETVFPLLDESHLAELTKLFGILSDRTRLAILVELSDGAKNVGTLCTILKLRQPAVSHHLGLLRLGNVVIARRDGKQIIYDLKGIVAVSKTEIEIKLKNHEFRLSCLIGKS